MDIPTDEVKCFLPFSDDKSMQKMFESIRRDIIVGGAVFLGTFAVYVFTMCPTIYWEDSAAFCAVHSLLGIPHSPGFPIYVILGRLFSLFSVSHTAFWSNLMSALWGSLGLAFLYLLAVEIFDRTKRDRTLLVFSITVSILLLAFSTSFWLQTVRAEVYTLNLFFTLALIFLVIKCWHFKGSGLGFRILLLLSFVLGLSLTNHPLLIITLVPAFLFFIFSVDLTLFFNPKKLFLMAILLLLGVSLYLYVPIRSSLLPAINWGKPDTWSNLVSYLFRTTQPGVSAFSSSIPYLNRLWFNLSFPVDQFGLPFFWLGVVGAVSLLKSCRKIFLFTLLIFVLNTLTATWATDFSLRNYDLLGYLLPSLCMFTIWFALGLKTVLGWVLTEVRAIQAHPRSDTYRVVSYAFVYALFGLFLLLPVFQASKNLDRCSKRSQTRAFRYAHQILNSVKRDALILVGDDNTLTSLWYLNLSCGERPDARILSISSLTQRGYREQVSRQYPNVSLPDLGQRDVGEIAYQVCKLNAANFPVYSTYFSNHPLWVRHLRPAGYLFEFCPQGVILTDKEIEEQRGFLVGNLKSGDFDVLTREHFGNILFNLGAFHDQSGGFPSSVEYFLWALDVDPANPRIYFQLGKAFLKNGDKAKASDFFQAGLELDPYNQEARKLLDRT